MFKHLLLSAVLISMPAAGTVAAKPKIKASDEPHFMPISSIRVPIVDGARVTGSLQIDLVLDAVDEAAASRLAANASRLRAASVAATLEFARLYTTSLTPVDAGELSNDVTRALLEKNPDIARVLVVKVAASPA